MASREAIALNRFGLGARPGDTAGSDPQGWLAAQIGRFVAAPPPIAALPGRAALADVFRDYRMLVAERRQDKAAAGTAAAAPGSTAPAGLQGQVAGAREGIREAYLSAVDARLAASLDTAAPFAERLVHFWANHFALSAEKPPVTAFAGDFEFTAIRPHVMGRFADLATAAITHPAMLIYLDQAQSIGPDSMLAQRAAARPDARRKLGINENLAREVMELHTLGVRTGYTQADVTEFARALTGWTVSGIGTGPLQQRLAAMAKPGDSLFVEALHQPGARTIVGKRYADDGAALAPAIIADLAAHPATSRHVATKLARHFAGDDPPPTLVARLEARYRETGGELAEVYKVLIASPEPWTADTAKFKTPWDWTVSALRAVEVTRLPNPQAGAGMLQQLGQPVWRPGSPAGWEDVAASWAGPGELMTRVELSERIASRVASTADARAIAPKVLPGALGGSTQLAIARADSPAQGLALLLVAPEFMRR